MVALRVPGEDALGVGRKQAHGRQIAAHGEQPVGFGQFRGGKKGLIDKTEDCHGGSAGGEKAGS